MCVERRIDKVGWAERRRSSRECFASCFACRLPRKRLAKHRENSESEPCDGSPCRVDTKCAE